MDSERKLLAELEQIQRLGSGARYSVRLRRDVLKYVTERTADGWSAGRIEREIGVKKGTWERWRVADGQDGENATRENQEEPKLTLVPVVVNRGTPELATIEIVFEMADGTRVRGRGNQQLWLDTVRALRGVS